MQDIITALRNSRGFDKAQVPVTQGWCGALQKMLGSSSTLPETIHLHHGISGFHRIWVWDMGISQLEPHFVNSTSHRGILTRARQRSCAGRRWPFGPTAFLDKRPLFSVFDTTCWMLKMMEWLILRDLMVVAILFLVWEWDWFYETSRIQAEIQNFNLSNLHWTTLYHFATNASSSLQEVGMVVFAPEMKDKIISLFARRMRWCFSASSICRWAVVWTDRHCVQGLWVKLFDWWIFQP